MHNLKPANNIDYSFTGSIMAFDVSLPRDPSYPDLRVESVLHPRETMDLTGKVGSGPLDSKRNRLMKFERTNGHWTVNGRTWEDVIDTDYKYCIANPGKNDIETWTLQNPSGGWFHPVHIHLLDFKVISRTG